MDYEDLLLNLTLSYYTSRAQLSWFDSNMVSVMFKTSHQILWPARPNRFYPPRALEVKSISVSLNRLYKMGLIKREKVKRKIVRKSDGKQFARGWKYMYLITNQGLKYARYLAYHAGESREQRHSNRNKKLWDVDDATISKYADLGLVSEKAASKLLERYKFVDSGIYRKFPRRFNRDLLLKYVTCRIDLAAAVSELDMIRGVVHTANRKRNRQIDRMINKMGSIQELRKKAEEARAKESGLKHLYEAKRYFEENNINIWIEPKAPQPLASFGIDRWPRVPLLDLLNLIIANISERR